MWTDYSELGPVPYLKNYVLQFASGKIENGTYAGHIIPCTFDGDLLKNLPDRLFN